MRDQSDIIVLHRNVMSTILLRVHTSRKMCLRDVCGEENRDSEEEEEEEAQPKFCKVGLCHSRLGIAPKRRLQT